MQCWTLGVLQVKVVVDGRVERENDKYKLRFCLTCVMRVILGKSEEVIAKHVRL